MPRGEQRYDSKGLEGFVEVGAGGVFRSRPWRSMAKKGYYSKKG
jgi:hypothetical protein